MVCVVYDVVCGVRCDVVVWCLACGVLSLLSVVYCVFVGGMLCVTCVLCAVVLWCVIWFMNFQLLWFRSLRPE